MMWALVLRYIVLLRIKSHICRLWRHFNFTPNSAGEDVFFLWLLDDTKRKKKSLLVLFFSLVLNTPVFNAVFTSLLKEDNRQSTAASASVLTRTKDNEHITPVSATSHRLPFSFSIYFNSLGLVFRKALHSSPNNISDCLKDRSPLHSLRSTNKSPLCLEEISREPMNAVSSDAAFLLFKITLWLHTFWSTDALSLCFWIHCVFIFTPTSFLLFVASRLIYCAACWFAWNERMKDVIN